MRYCGRTFTQIELSNIKELIASNPKATRAALSRFVCQLLQWYRLDGRLKEMSCRVAMLRMHEDGLLQFPPPRNGNNNGKPYSRQTQKTDPKPPVVIPSTAFSALKVEPVQDSNQSHLWNEYIQRYHYLGYAPVPGDQIRYIVRFLDQTMALLSFRAAVWKTAPRDQFIGWTHQKRKENLHLIINNARFLILPWVQAPNLASRILSMTTKRVVQDWEQRYHYSPVLTETFVEISRFAGTCYKAANWLYLGKTKGVGRLGNTNKPQLPIKSIWVYPLHKKFREKLCS
ncbi:MAG: DUF4338 domain-containing protein [Desulfobacterales bacterium]